MVGSDDRSIVRIFTEKKNQLQIQNVGTVVVFIFIHSFIIIVIQVHVQGILMNAGWRSVYLVRYVVLWSPDTCE